MVNIDSLSKQLVQKNCIYFTACQCNPVGSVNLNCEANTGKCTCKNGHDKLKCADCKSNFWKDDTGACQGKKWLHSVINELIYFPDKCYSPIYGDGENPSSNWIGQSLWLCCY